MTSPTLSTRLSRRLCVSTLLVGCMTAIAGWTSVARAERPDMAPPTGPDLAFLRQHCLDCHQGAEAEGGFDLLKLSDNLDDAAVERRWVRIYDRIDEGEMPPPDYATLDANQRKPFLQSTGRWLRAHQQQRHAELGRVQGRQLTPRELERSLHDLLGIDIPLADQIPQETTNPEFSTVASGHSISHFQLERHLNVVDMALDEAFRRAFSKDDEYKRDLSAVDVARTTNRRCREPEIRKGQAVVWSGTVTFYGRTPATTAPEAGWYRFKIRANGLKLPETGGVWTTVRSGLCVSSAPLLAWVGSFEAMEESREFVFECWLPKRHMLEIRPGDNTIRKARFQGGQVGVGEGEPQDVPGVAIDRIVMERFHRGPDNAGLRKLLFCDLKIKRDSGKKSYRPVTESPERDLERLMKQFARRAFRRPVSEAELSGYLDLAKQSLEQKNDFADAVRVGYRALLCSPRFMYLTEEPGPLDDHAIAARLSYMLTGSIPDAELASLADAGRLRDPAVLREQVERLLAGERGRQFVRDFAAEWLDLDQMDFTQPDRSLFSRFDPVVHHAMIDETHAFLEEMLEKNLSVVRTIDADYTYLNSRLARYYGIEGITGDALQRVKLDPKGPRGGLLTHGSILKVTANGSTTSPVVRGVWISERLLGEDIPPPPDSVPAIEPDIRGATSIREMLAKHRSQAACAGCHRKIDPPGFVLENFDPAGQYREWYGRPNRSAKIDPSYDLPDGRHFTDMAEFRRLIASEPHKVARNVVEKLMVFGTGAPISFADREVVEACVEQAAADSYGFRSLIAAVVTSPVFLSK